MKSIDVTFTRAHDALAVGEYERSDNEQLE